MKAAIMVLFDDQKAQTDKHKDWIIQGLVQRGASGRCFSMDLDAPDMVSHYLGRMVRFTAGKFHNNGDILNAGELEFSNGQDLTAEDVSFFKQLRKVLGPALKDGSKRVWLGKEEYDKRYGQKQATG